MHCAVKKIAIAAFYAYSFRMFVCSCELTFKGSASDSKVRLTSKGSLMIIKKNGRSKNFFVFISKSSFYSINASNAIFTSNDSFYFTLKFFSGRTLKKRGKPSAHQGESSLIFLLSRLISWRS